MGGVLVKITVAIGIVAFIVLIAILGFVTNPVALVIGVVASPIATLGVLCTGVLLAVFLFAFFKV